MWSEEEIEARFNALNLPADRQWENLKLSNDFLFGKVMQDIELCIRDAEADTSGGKYRENTFRSDTGTHKVRS